MHRPDRIFIANKEVLPKKLLCDTNSMDRIPWTKESGRLHRVTESWTQLKRLSMHACTKKIHMVNV